MWTPSTVRKPRALVASRSAIIWSSTKWHVSHGLDVVAWLAGAPCWRGSRRPGDELSGITFGAGDAG